MSTSNSTQNGPPPESNPELRKELIELEVKRAVSGEVEAYRKTVEAHISFLERSMKWFTAGLATLTTAAAVLFGLIFGRTPSEIRETVKSQLSYEVNELALVRDTKDQISNTITSFAITQKERTKDEIRQFADNLIQERIRNLGNTNLEQTLRSAIDIQVRNVTALPRSNVLGLLKPVPVGTILPYFASGSDPPDGFIFMSPSQSWPSETWVPVKLRGHPMPSLDGLFLTGTLDAESVGEVVTRESQAEDGALRDHENRFVLGMKGSHRPGLGSGAGWSFTLPGVSENWFMLNQGRPPCLRCRWIMRIK